MRPTFLGFETARRGLMTTQKGLDVVGHNLTNVSTPGYTRQRVDQVAVSASAHSSRYLSGSRALLAGQGVNIGGIAQVRDPFLDKRFRDEYGDVGYYDQMSAILGDVEDALDEFNSDTGLLGALSEIGKALNNFIGNADSRTMANLVASAFANAVQVLHQFSTKLDNVAEQQKYNLSLAVGDVNSMLEQVAALNNTIAQDVSAYGKSGYYGPNELLDERNLLLDELSRYADLTVQYNTDGTVTVDMNGHTVIEGQKAESMSVTRNGDGTVSLDWHSSGKTVQLSTGSFKASVEMLNGRGSNASSAGEGVEKGILYYKDKIDAFAKGLLNAANSSIPETDINGDIVYESGKIKYKTLLAARTQVSEGVYATSLNIPVTAANISLSDEWTANSGYFIFGSGNKDSTYAISLLETLKTRQSVFRTGAEVFTGTFEEFIGDYAGTYATDASFYTGRGEAAATIADSLLDRRDQISGVSTDEEAANMLLYQKSYQAIARVMTALDEALDKLINGTGRVGL